MQRRFVESVGFSADRFRLERAGELVIEDMVALEQSILADPNIVILCVAPEGCGRCE